MKETERQRFDRGGQDLFTRLYLEAFPAVAAFVSKKGGTLESAKDVFQDALIIYYEQVVTAEAKVQVSERAYLMGIAKHLWYGQLRESFLIEDNDLEGQYPEWKADLKEPELSEYKLMSFLETAGQRCMDMLKAFYYDKLSLTKISERFGFSGTRSATVQKFKCLEKVREEVKQRKLEYADFTE